MLCVAMSCLFALLSWCSKVTSVGSSCLLFGLMSLGMFCIRQLIYLTILIWEKNFKISY